MLGAEIARSIHSLHPVGTNLHHRVMKKHKYLKTLAWNQAQHQQHWKKMNVAIGVGVGGQKYYCTSE